MVGQIQNFNHRSQPQTVPDTFQGITRIFRQTIYEQDQTMYNYMVDQFPNLKLQIQPQLVPVSDLSISKVNHQNILVSADLGIDIYHVQAIYRVFSKPSNHDPHTSRLQTQTRFFTPLSCDLEPDISLPISDFSISKFTHQKILVSDDLGIDLDPVQYFM